MGRMRCCCLMHPCIASSSDRNRNSKNKQQLRSIEFKINICVLLIVTWCLVSLKSKFLGPIYPLYSATIIGTYSSVSSSSPSTYYNSSNFETETPDSDSDSVSVLIVFIDNDEAQLLMANEAAKGGEKYKKCNCGHNHRI
mgnify:CR=1 FL=1